MESIKRGRDRAVWVTASPFLAEQIKRDVKDVGLGHVPVHELSKFSLRARPNLGALKPGIMVCTYRGLLGRQGGGGEEDAAAEEAAGGPSRVEQLLSWLGEEWDGVLALDEAHKVNTHATPPHPDRELRTASFVLFHPTHIHTHTQAKNLKTSTGTGKGRRDKMKASQSALVIFGLQARLRNARVIYSSATIATSPDNLECLSRLGLWGRGTAFPKSADFADAMRSAGLPGMELLALNLKTEGKFLSRCLGFKVRRSAVALRCVALRDYSMHAADG